MNNISTFFLLNYMFTLANIRLRTFHKTRCIQKHCVIDFDVFPNDELCILSTAKRHKMLDGFLDDPIKSNIHISKRVVHMTSMLPCSFAYNIQETLIDSMNNPSKYLGLAVRINGYSIRFSQLSLEQQLQVISRIIYDDPIQNK